MAFAKNIGILRKHLGYSQDRFGKEFGATRGQVESYETGRAKKPSPTFATAICKRFNIEMDVLLHQVIDAKTLSAKKPKSEEQLNLLAALQLIKQLQSQLADKEEIIQLQKRLLNGNSVTKRTPDKTKTK